MTFLEADLELQCFPTLCFQKRINPDSAGQDLILIQVNTVFSQYMYVW